MRWVFWILGLFALAVALALALRLSTGYALLVWPPYRVELSLNLALLLLAAGFAVVYLLLRFIFGALGLPAQVRDFRERRRREKARRMLLEALEAFFEGRYGRAEQAAVSAMESGESPALGAVLAARAAHELRHYEQRDGYLARAEKLTPGNSALRIIAAASMLLDERRFQDALLALKALPERHTAALRLELKAQQQARNWEQTLPLVDQLERRGVFDAAQAGQLRRYAYTESLQRQALDRRALEECWQKIPARDKRDAKVAVAAAQCFAALGGCAQANQIIEQALDVEWNSDLVALYAECAGPDVVRQIERAENWLKTNPRDAVLLLVLGKLCTQQQLWGKAQSYLEASLSVEPTYSAHLGLAQLQEGLGNPDAALRQYRESLDLASAQLKQTAGGRRRMPV
ncbi:MAG: heme biosynthesis protein HemY [Betaproteobacteria bacterium]|nr:heme biosynthesis protein HemY [Betaproteobacteria bacterium]